MESKWGYYKRKSYINLAFIAVEEKDLENGRLYLKEIEKLPPPRFDCGVEHQNYESCLKRFKEAFK